jgi:hypothetical protein
MLIPMLANTHRLGQGKGMAGTRIFLGRRNNPDIITNCAGNRL